MDDAGIKHENCEIQKESDDGLSDNFIEYDLITPLHGSTRVNNFASNVTLEQLQQGTIINTPDKEEEAEIEEADMWWTKEELLKHLDGDYSPATDNFASWDEKIVAMQPLAEDQVYKKIIKNGFGPKINKNNAVLFDCNGYTEGSDEPFDSSVLRGRPLLHRLDQEDLLPGLMIGIQSMRENEKAEILIRPKYGFGELGCPPRIPANATIIYVVEIKKVYQEGSVAHYDLMTPQELAAVPFSEIIERMDNQRKSGNSYYRDKRFREAAIRYSKAIQFLEKYFCKDESQQKVIQDLISRLYSNAAKSFIMLKKLRLAMIYCRKALEINSNNLTVLYLYGKAKFCNGEYDEAKKYFTRALDINPGCSEVAKYLKKIEDKMKADEVVLRELYKKMGSILMK